MLDHIERLAGSTAKHQVIEKWYEHAARERVEVTVFGPYSSGKSSLIRRLVADAGGSIPSWLTVSGRPETFELNDVDAGALTFTDVPGFGSGRELHDDLSQEALSLSDAFLLVVPPQLLTTDRSFAGSVLSGEYFFGAPGGDLASVTVAAIGLADMLGIDPADDPAGMRMLADRKRVELLEQLRAETGGSLERLEAVCVAADPYEAQARSSQPKAYDFDAYRSWDGISDLDVVLARLIDRKTELREGAEVRFLCRAAWGVVEGRTLLLDEERSSAEDLRRRGLELSLIRRRLNAAIDSAKVDLQEALERAFRELGPEVADASEAAREHVNTRVQEVIESWVRRSNPKLEEIMSAAVASVDSRLESAAAQRTEAFLQSLLVDTTGTPGGPDPHTRILNILTDANAQMQRLARAAFENDLHRTLDDVLRPRVRNLPPLGELTKKDLNKALGAATSVVAILSEGVRLHQGHVEERSAREAREAATRQLRVASFDLADGIVEGSGSEPGWRSSADALLGTLRDQLRLPSDDAGADRLLENIHRQQELVDELRLLVTEGATFTFDG